MKKLTGKVVSLIGKNTAVVTVARRWRHPLYSKAVRRDKKYHCHYTDLDLQVNDQVSLINSRPISRLKRFKITAKLEQTKAK